MLLFKRVACNDCHVWTVGFFGRGFCGRQGGRGPENGADCGVDWRGIGVGGGSWKAERRGERSLTERLRKGQPCEITAYQRNVLLGKVCVFLGSTPNFPQTDFYFLGLSHSPPPHPSTTTAPPLPPFVVGTNCVAQRPLSQYEKVCCPPYPSTTLSPSLLPSPPLSSLSKHSLIECVFLNAKDNMSVYFSSAEFRHVFLRAFNLKRMIFFWIFFFLSGAKNQCIQLAAGVKAER